MHRGGRLAYSSHLTRRWESAVRYFLTKEWGFDVPVGPLKFAQKGWREDAIGKLSEGDRVVIVGTQGPPTIKENQGKLLGMVEPARERVSSLDFPLQHRPEHFNEGKEYIWPFGLHVRRAWRFRRRPLLEKILDRTFYLD